MCCRRWRHYGWWPRRRDGTQSTNCLTHCASNHETWAAQDCNTHANPHPDTHHHQHYLLHHPTHLHPAQSPSAPASAPATAVDSSTASVQACSTTYTYSYNIQHSHHPQSAPDPHPDTDGDHAQSTPHSYCPCFSVPPLRHPSSQPRHPGRGSQTHCPPRSCHHHQLCSVNSWPSTYWPHHRAPSGSPEPASPSPLSSTSGRHTTSCCRSHHPHHQPRPPSVKWHCT